VVQCSIWTAERRFLDGLRAERHWPKSVCSLFLSYVLFGPNIRPPIEAPWRPSPEDIQLSFQQFVEGAASLQPPNRLPANVVTYSQIAARAVREHIGSQHRALANRGAWAGRWERPPWETMRPSADNPGDCGLNEHVSTYLLNFDWRSSPMRTALLAMRADVER